MDSILLHIGYHKTGSGWLRRHFFVDPRTGFGSLGKDPGKHPVRRLVAQPSLTFDAASFRARFDELIEPVAAEGRIPVLSFERLSGHPFSGGYDSKEIADRLLAVFPEGRVLAVVREQRSIILSAYKQYVREGGSCSLRSFLAPPFTPSMRAPLFDLRFFQYDHLLSRYRKLFGPERVLILTYEQFIEDPAVFVAAIARFAGGTLDDEVLASLPFATKSNPSPSASAIELRRRVNHLGGVRTEIAPDPFIESKRLQRLARRIERTRLPTVLDARLEARLVKTVGEAVGSLFVESNRATAELAGLDLASHGWMV